MKNNLKYLTITTFPNKDWYDYLHVGTMSYLQHWPADVPLLVKLYKDDIFSLSNTPNPSSIAIKLGLGRFE